MEITKAYTKTQTLETPTASSPPRVAIYGHFDSDGHLAVEQSRLNLEAAGYQIKRIVIGKETINYRFWLKTLPFEDFGDVDLVSRL